MTLNIASPELFRVTRIALLLLLALSTVSYSAGAQTDSEPPHAGLLVIGTRETDEGEQTDHWLHSTVALSRSERNYYDQIEFHGQLQSQYAGEYRFQVYARGEVSLSIGGREVLQSQSSEFTWHRSEPIELETLEHTFQLRHRPAKELATNKPERAGAGLVELRVGWQGPGFEFEPVPAQRFRLPESETARELRAASQGADLFGTLHCDSCHMVGGSITGARLGPSLRQPQLLDRRWLLSWLLDQSSDHRTHASVTARRMPSFAISNEDASTLADYLLSSNEATVAPADSNRNTNKGAGKAAAEEGKRLFFSLGCLACHSHGEAISAGSVFGGSDLSDVGNKRPPEFFERWLQDPASLNSNHRMPVFELSNDERRQLAAFLIRSKTSETVSDDEVEDIDNVASTESGVTEGATLFYLKYQCGRCHQGPKVEQKRFGTFVKSSLTEESDWPQSCVASDDAGKSNDKQPVLQPRYRLSGAARASLKAYARHASRGASQVFTASQHLRAKNCLGCHTRDEQLGIASQAQQINKLAGHAFPPDQLVPPNLTQVGDKLHEAALVMAVAAKSERMRPWLQVRMPRYPFREGEALHLAHQLIQEDRMPEVEPRSRDANSPVTDDRENEVAQDGVAQDEVTRDRTGDEATRMLAGARLVTSDGFGCMSCHQIGSVVPGKTAPGTRGPKLNAVSRRIRQTWFERFVHNPTRIIPKLEMPSIQHPVKGVLNDQLPAQLAALWEVLDDPTFEPPEPNPVRIARQTGNSIDDRPIVITDVLRASGKTFVKPFQIGLGNRHNQLFDLATGSLARWSVGDLAQQRTEKKTWFWRAMGTPIFSRSNSSMSEISLEQADGTVLEPRLQGQFVTTLDRWRHVEGGVEVDYRLQFGADDQSPQTVWVRQRWTPLAADELAASEPATQELTTEAAGVGVARQIYIRGIASGQRIIIRAAPDTSWRREGSTFVADSGHATIRIEADAEWFDDGALKLVSPERRNGASEAEANVAAIQDAQEVENRQDVWDASVRLEYRSQVKPDRYAALLSGLSPNEPLEYNVVPGFKVQRLSLPVEILPISLAWRPKEFAAPNRGGRLLLGSLKGRVWTAADDDGDGLEDRPVLFSDELASPYGLAARDHDVDVLTKYAVIRLKDEDDDGRAEHFEVVASGWGHTDDYHDWAVGLPADGNGGYFMALPCQQDDRSTPAAQWRGRILQLVEREPTVDDPRRFEPIEYAFGQRFPMGLARNQDGLLFATDNQGNFNPFNELNWIRQRLHYGFINKLERDRAKPPLTRPAINIPHPWTRSVNGICFLETPSELFRGDAAKHFGPFEGHLIGCEYDTRRLIRMSLDRVNETIQGAAYPFSSEPGQGPTFLGPISIGVSPEGAIYVGNIRESGWGGANNIGELVRVVPQFDQLPCGIAEVTATSTGFHVSFTKPIEEPLARDLGRYRIESYFRVSTPAYGGDDQDRRTEEIESVRVTENRRAVHLTLKRFVPGRVYELRLRSLVSNEPFVPALAHYTLSEIPQLK